MNEDSIFILCGFLVIVLCVGEPDLLDTFIKHLNRE